MNEIEVVIDRAMEHAQKIMDLCDDEQWSAVEAVFAAGMAYVIMTKALEETDSVIVMRIARLTQGLLISQFNPKN